MGEYRRNGTSKLAGTAGLKHACHKLRGEMPADLMYGCAGDRPFLRRMKMDLPGFLTLVRDAGADDARIISEVKRRAGLC